MTQNSHFTAVLGFDLSSPAHYSSYKFLVKRCVRHDQYSGASRKCITREKSRPIIFYQHDKHCKTHLANTTISIARNNASDMSSIRLPLSAIPNAIMLLLCRDSLNILRTLKSRSTRSITRDDIELLFWGREIS